MEYLFQFLFVIGLILAVVTVVGHGIWVLLAAMFGASPARDGRPVGRRQVCPRCRGAVVAPGYHCPLCHWPSPETPGPDKINAARSQQALDVLQRQLQQFVNLGLLDSDTQRELEAILRRRREQLQREAEPAVVASPPHPAPSPAPPPETEAASEQPEVVEDPVDEPVRELSTAESAFRRRAEQFARNRQVAEAKADTETAADAEARAAKPPKETVPLSRLLAAFMEERNIRWGELVGGLLIVGCSIALVISFWAEIAERPFLKFFVFNGVTAALFGAGIYADRRLKLANTSEGLLIISAVLVPLNFLAIASFTDTGTSLLLTLAGEAFSVTIFAALLWLAGPVIVGKLYLPLAIGVLLPSIMTLLTRRFVYPESSTWILTSIGLTTVAAYASLTVWAIRIREISEISKISEISSDDSGSLESSTIHRLFKWLGIVSFASLVPLALLLARTEDPWSAAHRLAPLIGLLGAPSLMVGVLVWRRVEADALVALRTAGISIGVFGAGLLLVAIYFAWPNPAALVLTGLVDAVVFAAVGWYLSIAVSHEVAAICLGISWTVAAYALLGRIPWLDASGKMLREQLFSATTGWILVPFSILAGGAAWFCRRFHPHDATVPYVRAAAGFAVFSLLISSVFGFARVGDPHGLIWMYLLYGVLATTFAFLSDRRIAAWAASGLLLACSIQAIVFRLGGDDGLTRIGLPWVFALLAHASLASVLGWSSRWILGSQSVSQVTFGYSALVTIALATVVLPLPAYNATPLMIGNCLTWLALIILALLPLLPRPQLGLLFQIYSAGAVFWLVLASGNNTPWSAAELGDWLQPRLLGAEGIALSIWCGLWSLVRIAAGRGHWRRSLPARPRHMLSEIRAFLLSRWSYADHVVYGALVALLVGLATYAAVPGIGQELSPRPAGAEQRVVPSVTQFEIAIGDVQLSHSAAASSTSWLFLLVFAASGMLGLYESAYRWRSAFVLLSLWSAVPLLASLWEAEVAVASAMRWGLALAMLIASGMLWCRGRVVSRLPVRFERNRAAFSGHVPILRAMIVIFTFTPLVAMGAFVMAASVLHVDLDARVSALRTPLLIWTIVSLLIVLAVREGVIRSRSSDSSEAGFRRQVFGGLGLLIGFAPLLVWLLYAVAVALRQHPLTGPDPESLFVRMGLAASYAVPLFLMTAALVGTAIRDRSHGYAFAGAAMLHFSATSGFLLLLARLGLTLDAVAWVRVAQLNGLVAAVYALPWSIILVRRQRRTGADEGAPLLIALLGFAVVLCGVHLVAAVPTLFVRPRAVRFPADASHWLGWASVVMTLAVIAWYASAGSRQRFRRYVWHYLAAALLSASLLITWVACHWDRGNWLAYHTLLVLWMFSGCLLAVGGAILRKGMTGDAFPQASVRQDATGPATVAPPNLLLTVLVVIAGAIWSLRALEGDPFGPWWGAGGLVVAALQCTAIACRTAQRRYTYAAGALLNVAATGCWFEFATGPGWQLLDLIYVNLIAATIPCAAWVVLERKVFQPEEYPLAEHRLEQWRSTQWQPIGLHRLATAAALAIALLLTSGGLALDALGDPASVSGALAWGALLAIAQAVVLTLWDPQVRLVLFSLYLTGLLAVGTLLDSFNLSGELLQWTGTIFVAAYALATSFVVNRRRTIVRAFRQGRVPVTARQCRQALRWIAPVNGMVALFVLAMAFWASFTLNPFTYRFTSAQAALVQSLSIGLLAYGTRRSQLQTLSLLVGVLAAIPFSWVWVPPSMEAAWLHRLVALFVVMVLMSVLYSVGLVKLIRRENEWTRAAQGLVRLTVALSAASLTTLLIVEVGYYLSEAAVPMRLTALAITAGTLAAMIVAAIAAAVIPGRDPLRLSERQRSYYVYAAELLLALLVMHLRLTMPWLFAGVFEKYWPLIIMLIAFLGVGLAEYFQRRRQHVLSEPLARTGILLPIVPVLGFWILPHTRVDYAGLLLSVGAFYAVLSVARRSFAFAMVAVAAVNLSLWHLLYRLEGLGLAEHPQLWIIPPAACVLVAAHLNARQLGPQRMIMIRYLTATFIYASSTADIFLNGVAQAPWLPIVLAAISLAGIFLGIWLRIRAFLYLGVAFLFIALLTVIWYAAVDLQQTWIWWVSGIVTGVLIIALFAVFEKKREHLLQLVDELKEWDG